MDISARNQVVGRVQHINQDDVMADITVQIAEGVEVVSVITAASARRLNLQVGSQVTVVVKSTDVMLAVE